MQPSKWDLVLGQKPVPLQEHLLEEAAKLFAKDLAVWPPRLEALDPATSGPLGALLQETPARPEPVLYAEAFRLTRMDLARELDAYDDYFRNRRFLEVGLTPGHKGLLLFVSRFMTEQLLGLGEATQGRLSRPKLLEILDKTRRHFFGLAAQR